MIRVARPEDVVHFPEIERASGAAFRERDMASIADDGPLPAHELLAYQRAGRAWVATDDVDEPVAYLVLDIVDESAHVEQVSVDPAYAHHRLGQALLDAEAAWAHEKGLGAMTLTTFGTCRGMRRTTSVSASASSRSRSGHRAFDAFVTMRPSPVSTRGAG